MLTNTQFVAFCKAAKGKVTAYMWGDYGRPITGATITAKAKQYPEHYDAAYQQYLSGLIGTGIGCDCSGLIKWFLWTGGDINAKPVYNGDTDNSASGWYNTAKVRGAIGTLPERPGLIVSMDGHCGVYIGGGRVIECTKGKFGNGVVETALGDRPWEKWCECAWIDYTAEEAEAPALGAETVVYYGGALYTNGGTRLDVYATSALADRIGSLDPHEVCHLMCSVGSAANGVATYGVLYEVTENGKPTGEKKLGFIKW